MLANALSLDWAFGFSKDKINTTSSLCLKDRNALFLISSHSGIIYDFEHRTQTILQGHCNIISCCVVDKHKRWIVTADAGVDPIMVVWDAVSFAPVKTFLLPHEGGVEALDISDDSLYIATLGCPTSGYSSDQELAIWAWTLPSTDAILRSPVNTEDYQYTVKFDLSDNSQVVTTGEKSILFWRWDDFNLSSYSGRVSKTDLGHFGGEFVTTIFLPSTENALTATSEGHVIVWESNADEEKQKWMGHAMKEATKVLKLVDCGITIMTTTRNDYLAVACSDGAVRFYDYFLRLEAWFEDLNAGPITSVSFSVQDCPFAYGEAGAPGLKFWVPDFVVGTSDGFVVGVESSVFDEVRREDRRGTLLMQGMSEEVTAVSCHPSEPLVVIACANGVLQIWNYDMKLLMILREFNSSVAAGKGEDRRLDKTKVRSYLKPSCVCFGAGGKVLAVGFTSGLIKLLFTENLEDGNSYAPSSEAILCVKFSSSGKFLAAYDNSRHVLLFKKEEAAPEAEEKPSSSSFTFGRSAHKPASPGRIGSAAPPVLHDASFVYIGRARSHTAPIVGITFGHKDGAETLISVSEDQYCVEYDLEASSLTAGIICVKTMNPNTTTVCSHRVELAAKPTAVMWHPKLDGDFEDRFVVSNDVFKLKEFNLESKQCRRTSLAPRFGNPPTALLPIPPLPLPSVSQSDNPDQAPGQFDQFLESNEEQQAQQQRAVGEAASAPSGGGEGEQKAQDYNDGAAVEGEEVERGEQEQERGPKEVVGLAPPATEPVPEYFAFSTSSRVIGVSSFPLTGDPSQTMGIVAHPGDITSVDVSFDGRFMFSAGGFDLSVNMWKIDVEEHRLNRKRLNTGKKDLMELESADHEQYVLRTREAEAAQLKPFFSLLEGGEDGELHHDIIDYFYYCQLRHLGEDSMETRTLTGVIPLEEIPSLFRAVGYYPSEEEVQNIINEVRYKDFVNTGETQEFVGLAELIRLYINHRPCLPLDKVLISSAFDSICDGIVSIGNNGEDDGGGGGVYSGFGGEGQISWEQLRSCLTEEGECVSAEDLDAYLVALTGSGADGIPPHQLLDPKLFAEHILGFEDFATNA